MTAVIQAIVYDPPLVAANNSGLYGAVNWLQDGTEPVRFFDSGVEFRPQNTGLDTQVGVWTENWLVSAASIVTDKTQDRTTDFPDAFTATVVYAWDHNYNGDLTAESRSEVDARARHAMNLLEVPTVEGQVASRLVTDAGSVTTKTGLVATVGYLEGELAKKGIEGYFHVGAQYAAYASEARLNMSGRTPLGHRWVFGGGYVAGLGAKIVVTTQPYGWRGPATLTPAFIKYDQNQYLAVAERSTVIGYEAVLAAATIG